MSTFLAEKTLVGLSEHEETVLSSPNPPIYLQNSSRLHADLRLSGRWVCNLGIHRLEHAAADVV